MNKSSGHCLLFDDLTTTITLTIKLLFEMTKMLQVSNGIEALDAFSLELIFQNPCKKKL
jgi:hypothetical protein